MSSRATPDHHDASEIEQRLALLDSLTREPPTLPDDEPIFIASIGWRSGSTLVQRTMMTDESVLIWGEPLGHLCYVERLAEPLLAFTASWPPADHWISHRPDVDLVRDWVANLAPDPGHLKAAHRAFLDQWLAAPARDRGFRRWGVKEVRWSSADAVLLRWLYPKAHFLLLARHPVDAYRSMRNFGLEPPAYGFLDRWPDRWAYDADTWGRLWNARAESWRGVAERLGAPVIRYEDLMAKTVDLRDIGARFGLSLKPEAAAEVKAGGPLADNAVTPEETSRILELTASGREMFGYGEG